MVNRRGQPAQQLAARLVAGLVLLALAIASVPPPAAHAAYGDDPHTYGEILVYDNTTSNPAPGDGFGGGYAGYPHQPAGIQLPVGMYRVRASWQGSNVQARIYQRNELYAGCEDLFSGLYLGDHEGAAEAGHVAVMPFLGNGTTGYLCTHIYIGWRDGLSVRLQIYRVFEPELGATPGVVALRTNVPVDAYAAVEQHYAWTLFPQSVITVTLQIAWVYTWDGDYAALRTEPHAPTTNEINGNNCLGVESSSGFENSVCVGQTRTFQGPEIAGHTIRIHTRPYGPVGTIFHIEVDIDRSPPTPTATATAGAPTPSATSTVTPTATIRPSPTPRPVGSGCVAYYVQVGASGPQVSLAMGRYLLRAYWDRTPPYNAGTGHELFAIIIGTVRLEETYEGGIIRLQDEWEFETVQQSGPLLVESEQHADHYDGMWVTIHLCPAYGSSPTPTPPPTNTPTATRTSTATSAPTATSTSTSTPTATSTGTPLPSPTAGGPPPTFVVPTAPSACVLPTPAGPDQRLPLPELQLVVPTWQPLPTIITATVVISASGIISSTYLLMTAVISPAAALASWSQDQFGPDGWARGSAAAAPIALLIAGAFGWLGIFSLFGQLNWFLPVPIAMLFVRITKAILSILKYVKQILPFQ